MPGGCHGSTTNYRSAPKPTPFSPPTSAWRLVYSSQTRFGSLTGNGDMALFGSFCLLYGHVCPFLAQRSDITIAFTGFWAALIFGRALYLGDPMPIPIHSMQNGALLIFAFFMISDPKTTPDTRLGRCLFAGIVALVAYIMQYHFYNPNGLIYALAFLSPLTLLIKPIGYRGPHTNGRNPSRTKQTLFYPTPLAGRSNTMNQKHLSVLTVITLLSLNAQTAAAFAVFTSPKQMPLS